MAVYSKNGTQLNAVYGLNGDALQKAYNKAGTEIFSASTPVVDYSSYTKSNYCAVSLSPTQGFDIHNGVIFQFLANSSTVNNRMATVNASTSSIISNNITASADHGDSASFSDEYFADDDTYPLLYVTADTNPAKVYINRVTTTTSTLVKTLSFPLDKTGYYAALCLDIENGIAYMVGYSKQNYLTDDSGTNKTVISKWDLTDLTANQDGSYTPAYISSVEREFIYVMQGQQFHDGMLWISSGGTNVRGYIYALDPSTGELLYTVDTESTTEIEGLAFISDYEMVFGLQGGAYKLVTFAHS